ncbi:MAG: hypothetical protein WAW42_17530 [Candidatus Competibacteraceae bacterium]
MRGHLDLLVTEKTLSLINDSMGSEIPDHLADSLPLKNVCAKVTPTLSSEIDEVCNFLGVSKRRFLEAAFVDAVASAREIMRREGLLSARSFTEEDAERSLAEGQP